MQLQTNTHDSKINKQAYVRARAKYEDVYSPNKKICRQKKLNQARDTAIIY